MYVCSVCVCVFVREGECVCVCVCVCKISLMLCAIHHFQDEKSHTYVLSLRGIPKPVFDPRLN